MDKELHSYFYTFSKWSRAIKSSDCKERLAKSLYYFDPALLPVRRPASRVNEKYDIPRFLHYFYMGCSLVFAIFESIANPGFSEEKARFSRIRLELTAQLSHIDPQILCLFVIAVAPDLHQ